MSKLGTSVRLRTARIGLSLELLAALFAVGAQAHGADTEARSACATPVGRIVSVQGTVEVQRAGQQAWSTVKRLDTPLCQRDFIRTGSASRAALVVLPEKFIRVDQNSTLSIEIKDDETVVELTQGGAGYFITRFPRKFKVNTQFLNAAVEGTEFMVSAGDAAAAVSVFEGKVSAQSTSSSGEQVILKSGETASAGAGQPPTVKVTVKPLDAVQWVLYYPPLGTTPIDANPDQSCDQADAKGKSSCLTIRAEERLRVGRVDEAQADIEESLRLVPDSSDADALLSIISVVKSDKTQALMLAQRATEKDSHSPRAWIALSYAQQSDFKLEDALASAERAVELSPRNATAQSRRAELLMSVGRIRGAERAAQAAVDADVNDSRAHAILGFAHLAQFDTKKARADFAAAIEHDSSDPLPHLGLGLAIIRDGDLKAGREQIEIAVMLDPTNSLIRSYVGKAYYQENTTPRDRLAATQFAQAKALDAKDPTPWLYDAILKQTQNRPVEAVQALEESIDLNDDRAVYRSRLLLDQDLAARAVGLSVLYSGLGMDSRALAESTQSLAFDPANYSAHRFLAESYSALPRHEIAQVSELLQSQLLQPLNLNPLPPQLSESDLLRLSNGAPSDPSFSEYTSLFTSDGARVQLNGVGGTQGTWGDDLLISALKGPLSLSAGQFHYETDGWRPNSDYMDDLYSAFAQLALSDQTSAQIEVRTRRVEDGDISMRVTDPAFDPTYRRSVDQDTARFGFHHKFAPGTELIGSVVYQDRTEKTHQENVLSGTAPFFGPFTSTTSTDTDRHDRGTTAELQLQSRLGITTAVTGGGYTDTSGLIDQTITGTLVFPLAPFLNGTTTTTIPTDASLRQKNVYLYTVNRLRPGFDVTIAVAEDWYKDVTIERQQTSPKIGLVWSPTAATQVRAAVLRVLKRALIADETIEPTQVAGFNQFFDDPNGTQSDRAGIGIDHRFSPRVFGNLEASARNLKVPRLIGGQALEESQREYLYRGSLTYLPWKVLALSAQAQLEQLDIDPADIDPTRPLSIYTTRLPLEARLFPDERWSFFLQMQNIWQEVETQDTLGQRSKTRNDFSLFNGGVSMRLPQRRGTVSLQVNNIFSQSFQYQDMNFRSSVPMLPEFLPERSIYLRVNLVFP